MVLILKDAVNPKEFLTVDHHAVLLVKVRIHNHVRNSCLIFQTQKDEALRRSRTLPSDSHPATRVYCPSCTRGKSHARFTWSLDRASRQYVIGCGPVLMPDP